MNKTEQVFAPELVIPTDTGYTYGWGIRPEGSEGGCWMYVKGISYEGQAFEHWAFMQHKHIALFDSNPALFFKHWGGIKEVVEINRDLAWRNLKSQFRIWGA
jgi:hypothetical protein